MLERRVIKRCVNQLQLPVFKSPYDRAIDNTCQLRITVRGVYQPHDNYTMYSWLVLYTRQARTLRDTEQSSLTFQSLAFYGGIVLHSLYTLRDALRLTARYQERECVRQGERSCLVRNVRKPGMLSHSKRSAEGSKCHESYKLDNLNACHQSYHWVISNTYKYYVSNIHCRYSSCEFLYQIEEFHHSDEGVDSER